MEYKKGLFYSLIGKIQGHKYTYIDNCTNLMSILLCKLLKWYKALSCNIPEIKLKDLIFGVGGGCMV